MGNALIDNFSKQELEDIVLNSFSLAEVMNKLGYMTNKGRNSDTVKKRLEWFNISTDHFMFKPPIRRNVENVFCEYSTASQQTLRRWFSKRKDVKHICSICGQIPYWNNKELTLILDHINGNKHDNRIENLRLVCPNCNQQLETTKHRVSYRRRKNDNRKLCEICGKEISKNSSICSDCNGLLKRKAERPSRDDFKKMIRTLPFTAIGKLYNVNDNAIRRWCDSYNLPRKKYEIMKFTDKEWQEI